MKITIHSTTKIVDVNGVLSRIWEGETASGIAVHCFITRIGIANEADSTEFDEELEHHEAPSVEMNRYPLSVYLPDLHN